MSESTRRSRLGLMLLGAFLASSPVLAGCVTHHHHHGSPPTAQHRSKTVVRTLPSHRARHVHTTHSVTLVYDRAWDGYWVRELPHHYYSNGVYFRWYGNRWHRSRHPHGPWLVVRASRLPGGLHRHHLRIAREEAERDWKRARREARRADPREARQEHREEPREARREHREEHHELRQGHPRDRRDARREHRGTSGDRRLARRPGKEIEEDPRDSREPGRSERRARGSSGRPRGPLSVRR